MVREVLAVRLVLGFVLFLFGCHSEFEFEIWVGPLEPDMVVLADGVEQEHEPDTDNSLRATFRKVFDSYDDGLRADPTQLFLFLGADQETFQTQLSPGICANEGSGWIRESYYVSVRQEQPGTWIASVTGHRCASPSEVIIGVYD